MALKPTTEGSIKRKKHAEAKDARPKPPKASKDRTIRMLLGRLYGDREFLDQVLQEAGDNKYSLIHNPTACSRGALEIPFGCRHIMPTCILLRRHELLMAELHAVLTLTSQHDSNAILSTSIRQMLEKRRRLNALCSHYETDSLNCLSERYTDP